MSRDDEIFAQAFELPVAERAAFLNGACAADAAQRARIEALLAADEEAGSFMDRSPGAAALRAAEEKAGDVIGRYTLLEKIGEGGCGTVYLAEQNVPVQRKVALKVIKLGMDTRAVITRFEAERQALALMDHPDIARVFDAGATEAGRPFFVMELVTGEPITRFCDQHALSVPARLELFSRVCAALQHAHQKGIIHRDVKPSNILVTMQDDVPSPKVIDFGIAKATQERLTDETLVTAVDQFIGTPAYMSPEQADRRTADIDTRSDIYALGVLLYELLTGRLPFDPQLLARAGVDELRRITREVEPLRPSVRLRTLGLEAKRTERVESASAVEGVGTETCDSFEQAGRPDQVEPTLAAIASARGSSPLQLASALKGDLDWIVMRCLEKDRERRYGSARELADDVQRYLHREPVRARPPSVHYRLERFVARNRVACASAAAIALALVVGTVVSVRQAVRATRAEQVANAERDAAKAAGQAEALARADAQRRQEQAEDLLTFMLGDFRTELQKIGRLQLLDAVGEKAMAYFAALDPRDLTDTALARQAKALTQIGEVRMDQARYADAHAAFTAAYDRAAALAQRHPKNGDMLFERAQAEYWIGFVARKRGDSAAEREWLTRYRDSAVELVAVEGKTKRAQLELMYGHHNLAVLDLELGNVEAARSGFTAEMAGIKELLRQSAEDVELLSTMADVCSWMGAAAEQGGGLAEARKWFGEMRTSYASLAQREPSAAIWKYRLAQAEMCCGEIERLLGRVSEASGSYILAEAELRRLVAQDPKNRQWEVQLVNALLARAQLIFAGGDLPGALSLSDECFGKLEGIALGSAVPRDVALALASAWRRECEVLLAAGRFPQAETSLERAVRMSERVTPPARGNIRMTIESARNSLLAGQIAMAQRQQIKAEGHLQRVVELTTSHTEGARDWRILQPAAQALVMLERVEQARPLIDRLHEIGYIPIEPLAGPTLRMASLPWANEHKN